MIKIVEGDLLQAKEDIIAHQVNCMGVMGSGVAKQIREKYPKAYDVYKKRVDEYMVGEDHRQHMLGRVQGVVADDGKVIFNMFSQYKFGYDGAKYTNTESLFECLMKIRTFAQERGLSVALPYKIGCFRGGADWDEVENLILKAFRGYEVTLYKL